MTTKKHRKHAKLEKPKGGKFHFNEIAILGAPCGIIQSLTQKINEKLQSKYRVAFVDADHHENGAEKPMFYSKYTDKINFHRLDLHTDQPEFQYRSWFRETDLVLVNGNHFKAEKQIVIINDKKKESLSRKLDRLTDVRMILLDEGLDEVHPFILEHFSDSLPPVFSINEISRIVESITKEIRIPSVNGLVFAGGKSLRMGHDKGEINYFGKPQREYAADLLSIFCKETYLSTQPDPDFTSKYKFLEDRFIGLGPYGGLLTAFMHNPTSAWLAISCDVPLVDEKALEFLLGHRDPSKMATCYHNPETKFPEPLITLWEPKAYPILLQFLSMGYSCPRKALINSDINEIMTSRPEILKNVNTPEELQEVKSMIHV